MTSIENSVGSQMSALIRARLGYGQRDDDQADEQADEQPTDFDGGARTTSPGPVDMNKMIRRAAGF